MANISPPIDSIEPAPVQIPLMFVLSKFVRQSSFNVPGSTLDTNEPDGIGTAFMMLHRIHTSH